MGRHAVPATDRLMGTIVLALVALLVIVASLASAT
jgi:hypothetical protein